jgi:hypothetical protein
LPARVELVGPFTGSAGWTRTGSGSSSSFSRIFGGSFPPPLESAAAFRAESSFAGGLCGRDRLGIASGSVPETVKVRTFVPRGRATPAVRAERVPR